MLNAKIVHVVHSGNADKTRGPTRPSEHSPLPSCTSPRSGRKRPRLCRPPLSNDNRLNPILRIEIRQRMDCFESVCHSCLPAMVHGSEGSTACHLQASLASCWQVSRDWHLQTSSSEPPTTGDRPVNSSEHVRGSIKGQRVSDAKLSLDSSDTQRDLDLPDPRAAPDFAVSTLHSLKV